MEIIIKTGTSINKALLNIKPNDTLILEDGIYQEKVEVWNSNITIKAQHKNKAIISNKDYYHKIMENNNECNTFGTYTMLIGGNNVTLDGLVIKNDAIPSSIYGQAVALHVNGTNFLCKECIIQSAQDTLFTGPMPKDLIERYQGFYEEKKLEGKPSKQKYINCEIVGDVDFIFGSATALFEACDIVSLERKDGMQTYICAPSHPSDLPFGYLFYKCKLKSKTTTPCTYLGRPWRDYGCAAFIECDEGSHIMPLGFNKWNNTNRDKTARFFEYAINQDLTKREPWIKILTMQEAEQYVNDFMNYLKW